MTINRPIGVFDSGLGGISVLNHLTELLPDERFIYIADSAWCPYGNKSYQKIRKRATDIVDYFMQRDVKMVVVACNTATAAAIEHLRATYMIPFVGMEPAIKPAARLTQNNTVGVLATPITFNGTLFQETRQKYASHINVVIQKGCGLVELVENNQTESAEAFQLLEKYTTPMIQAGADYLVLGCTHYPFLMPAINKVAPSLRIIDPALPVAKRVRQVLSEHHMLSQSSPQPVELFTSGEVDKLKAFADTFIKQPWHASKCNFL